jgi:isopentenyl diphosphate isomerase/L-lactate dehydrogenase-like FMN-dependent dehydrogenase
MIFRRGTDIFKAIALGAKAILIGRPILWGLAVQGEQGVINILNILKKEFQLAMNLSDCRNIEDITKNNLLIINRSKL